MTPNKQTRILGYARVSTREQAAEGHSIAAQVAKIRAYAELHELELVEVIVDEGVSAKSLDRPGLERALELLRSGEVGGVVVTKLDRLTRRTRDLLGLVDELFQDRALVSISEKVDTASASGRLLLTVLGALASWERETIGERTREVLAELRAQGVRMGRPGYGWCYSGEDDVDTEGRRRVVAVVSERRTVRRAKSLRSKGLTLRAIAEALTAEGHQTKRGGRWHAKTVRTLVGEAA